MMMKTISFHHVDSAMLIEKKMDLLMVEKNQEFVRSVAKNIYITKQNRDFVPYNAYQK